MTVSLHKITWRTSINKTWFKKVSDSDLISVIIKKPSIWRFIQTDITEYKTSYFSWLIFKSVALCLSVNSLFSVLLSLWRFSDMIIIFTVNFSSCFMSFSIKAVSTCTFISRLFLLNRAAKRPLDLFDYTFTTCNIWHNLYNLSFNFSARAGHKDSDKDISF